MSIRLLAKLTSDWLMKSDWTGAEEGDPVPIGDWLEIYVDRIDDRTIAIGGYHRPEGGYRSELTIACWTEWGELKKIGRPLSAHASVTRLLLNRPKCFSVIDGDARGHLVSYGAPHGGLRYGPYRSVPPVCTTVEQSLSSDIAQLQFGVSFTSYSCRSVQRR